MSTMMDGDSTMSVSVANQIMTSDYKHTNSRNHKKKKFTQLRKDRAESLYDRDCAKRDKLNRKKMRRLVAREMW